MRLKILANFAEILSPRRHARARRGARARCLGALGLIGAALAGGCVSPSDAQFTLASIAQHQDCLENASPLQASSSFARVAPGGVGLFFQTDSRQASAGDAIYLHVYQTEQIRAHPGQSFALADPRELQGGEHTFDAPPVVRGAAYFADSCPEVPESFGVIGTVIFSEFGTEKGDRMRGELRDAQIISLRDDSVVVGELSGTWDFTVNLNRPRQYFPNTPVQDSTGRLP